MQRHTIQLAGIILLFGLGSWALAAEESGPPLPGTKPLTMGGDIASELVAGVDRFLLKQIGESTAKRSAYWKRDPSSPAAYQASVEPNRKRLAHILGVRDRRAQAPRITRLGAALDGSSEEIGKDKKSEEQACFVSWPAFGDVTGEGLELGAG